jgi:hypothetical protein
VRKRSFRGGAQRRTGKRTKGQGIMWSAKAQLSRRSEASSCVAKRRRILAPVIDDRAYDRRNPGWSARFGLGDLDVIGCSFQDQNRNEECRMKNEE